MTAGLDRPVLITGTPRSGKTCVSSIVQHDPAFVYLNEPLTTWEIGMSRRTDDRRAAAEATEVIRSEIRRICEREVERAGKTRYFDDLSYHAVRIPFVTAVMPEAKIVHVIRDPYDAIPEMLFGWTYRDTFAKAIARRRSGLRIGSLPRHALRFLSNYVQSRFRGRRATWGPRVAGLIEFQRKHSAAEVAAFQWMSMVEIAQRDLAARPACTHLEVRYDRLLDNPREEARRLAAFVEASDPEGLVDFAVNFVQKGFPFEKKVQLTEEEWASIEKLIAPLADRLGYGAPSAARPA